MRSHIWELCDSSIPTRRVRFRSFKTSTAISTARIIGGRGSLGWQNGKERTSLFPAVRAALRKCGSVAGQGGSPARGGVARQDPLLPPLLLRVKAVYVAAT